MFKFWKSVEKWPRYVLCSFGFGCKLVRAVLTVCFFGPGGACCNHRLTPPSMSAEGKSRVLFSVMELVHEIWEFA